MIEINNKKLCESCFSETEEEKCPHCGFSKEEYAPDAMVLPLGTKLNDKIIIGRVMGKGGFGVTYLGYDLRMEKTIAVKEYYPNGIAYRSQSGTEVLVADPKSNDTFNSGTEKFYTEAEMVAQFNGNPNIVGVYDYFRANNTVYLIMEYLNGVTLKNYVKKRGNITDGQALYVMDKMAAALSITHSAGVLHRDISPDNIMVCLDGKVKLIDFGAARQIVAESSSNLTVVMKPGYTPIEQYTKKGKQGAWTDIYALGASIYYAMTGKIIDDPYERMENDNEFNSNIHGINDSLWNVIKKCTMINASDRYGNAIELRKALSTVSAPVKPEPIVLDSEDVKIEGEEEAEVKDILASAAPKGEEPIELFASSQPDGDDEDGIQEYELPAVPEGEGYKPGEDVYSKDEAEKKPVNKKLLIGIAGAAAAVAAIVVGIVLFAGRPDSSIPAIKELNLTPLVYLGFENTDGLTSVKRTTDTSGYTGASFGIAANDKEIILAEDQGVYGSALYLDGTYGVDFDMPHIDDDSYTISFWFNADQSKIYSPIVQVGHNMGMDPGNSNVTWINFTKLDITNNFPIVWSRNSSLDKKTDIWPWIEAGDGQSHGVGEWCLLTLVADGVHYSAGDGMERVHALLYLNGKKMWESSFTGREDDGLSPNVLKGSNIEGHIGINYWDPLYKGFVDELYVFDEALTDEQVKKLYEMGNSRKNPVIPTNGSAGGTEKTNNAGGNGGSNDPVSLSKAPVDRNAICTLGTTSRKLEFWSENTDGYKLNDGESLTAKFNLYSDQQHYYDTLVTAFTNTAVSADLIPNEDNYSGYSEYAVVRADYYGWGDGSFSDSYEYSWDDIDVWLALTTDAEVELTITRSGSKVTLDYVFTGADGTVMTETAVIDSSIKANSPVYVHFTGEGSYIELLSVKVKTAGAQSALRIPVTDKSLDDRKHDGAVNVSDFSDSFKGDVKVTIEIEFLKEHSDGEWGGDPDTYTHFLGIKDKSGKNVVKTTFNMAITGPPEGDFFFGPLLFNYSGEDGRLRTFEFVLTQDEIKQIDTAIHFVGENCNVKTAIFQNYDPNEYAFPANAEKIELGVMWGDGSGRGSTNITKSKLESFGGDVRITLDIEGEALTSDDDGISHIWVRDMEGGIPVGVYMRNQGFGEDHAYRDGYDGTPSYVLGHWSLIPKQVDFVITAEQIKNLSSEEGLYFHTLNARVKAAYLCGTDGSVSSHSESDNSGSSNSESSEDNNDGSSTTSAVTTSKPASTTAATTAKPAANTKPAATTKPDDAATTKPAATTAKPAEPEPEVVDKSTVVLTNFPKTYQGDWSELATIPKKTLRTFGGDVRITFDFTEGDYCNEGHYGWQLNFYDFVDSRPFYTEDLYDMAERFDDPECNHLPNAITEFVVVASRKEIEKLEGDLYVNGHNIILNSVKLEDAETAAANDFTGTRTQPTVLTYPGKYAGDWNTAARLLKKDLAAYNSDVKVTLEVEVGDFDRNGSVPMMQVVYNNIEILYDDFKDNTTTFDFVLPKILINQMNGQGISLQLVDLIIKKITIEPA